MATRTRTRFDLVGEFLASSVIVFILAGLTAFASLA
jgi:hypothetical protein